MALLEIRGKGARILTQRVAGQWVCLSSEARDDEIESHQKDTHSSHKEPEL